MQGEQKGKLKHSKHVVLALQLLWLLHYQLESKYWNQPEGSDKDRGRGVENKNKKTAGATGTGTRVRGQ